LSLAPPGRAAVVRRRGRLGLSGRCGAADGRGAAAVARVACARQERATIQGAPDASAGADPRLPPPGGGRRVASHPVSFRPEARRGAGDAEGVVDYRLTRQAVLREYRKGRLSRTEVCDAHPELRRAAAGVGTATDQPCPICEEEPVTLVTYAFGPRLPAGGRCITSAREMARLARGRVRVACYVVEVCVGCAWNHLTKVFHVGGG
jgi:hypothetical protein